VLTPIRIVFQGPRQHWPFLMGFAVSLNYLGVLFLFALVERYSTLAPEPLIREYSVPYGG
jgi:hypothetical protein